MRKMNYAADKIFKALALLLVAGLGSLAADDWPQWRGPNRDGISKETGLLKEWPASGPRLVWKAAGLGSGYSTVAVVGERIYTTGDRADANYLVALNLADGKILWSAKLGGKAGAPGWGGFAGPRATPTVGRRPGFRGGSVGRNGCFNAGDARNCGERLHD
jgi:outer membrane protein assembly factor BamB